jgi:hypothetical protein
METDHARSQAEAQLENIVELSLRLTDVKDWGSEEEYKEAREAIRNHPREVLTRSNWATGTEEWNAQDYQIIIDADTRVIGKLGNYDQFFTGYPQTAQLEYSTSGKWTRLALTREDIDALLAYAGCFYFGE